MFIYRKIALSSFTLIIFIFTLSVTFANDNSGIPLVINEFMASNDSIIQDPQGQYEDWVEIYNYGTGAIDLAGR